jgi:cobalt-precorrin-5B (C1)-methyltransferase
VDVVRTHEPPLSPDAVAGRGALRTGWTTGTCASAAAKAAATALVHGDRPMRVEVGLPGGRRVGFPVEWEDDERCVVVKDAGDDPDCTDGARMTAEARWLPGPDRGTGPELRVGPGVGTVTRPGLGLPVGAPAVNPVPRRVILAALAEVTARPVAVTFSVPGGEAMAGRTSNARLGIVGGISILGTTGVVRPFSTAAYRASVLQQIDVASAGAEVTVVLSTGSRSDAAAQRLYPDLDGVCFVEVGDYTGAALRHAARRRFRQVPFVGMVGKIAKLAAGVMMTHFHRSHVDGQVMAEAARHTGAPAEVVEAATATATARHFLETCLAHGCLAPLDALCRQARRACEAHVAGALAVPVTLVDFEGASVLARA